jgi:hypothetical protein
MIVTSLCYNVISSCNNVISYVKNQMRYPIPAQSLTAGRVAEVEHHCYPDVDQPTALLRACCTRATCPIVSRPVWQYKLLFLCWHATETWNRAVMSDFASLSALTRIGREEARSPISHFAGQGHQACIFHHHESRVWVNLTVAQAE